jgi:hypothetical protein
MRRTPLAAMLTLLAVAAATLAFSGCGSKSSGAPAKGATTSTGTQKQPSHPPAY